MPHNDWSDFDRRLEAAKTRAQNPGAPRPTPTHARSSHTIPPAAPATTLLMVTLLGIGFVLVSLLIGMANDTAVPIPRYAAEERCHAIAGPFNISGYNDCITAENEAYAYVQARWPHTPRALRQWCVDALPDTSPYQLLEACLIQDSIPTTQADF